MRNVQIKKSWKKSNETRFLLRLMDFPITLLDFFWGGGGGGEKGEFFDIFLQKINDFEIGKKNLGYVLTTYKDFLRRRLWGGGRGCEFKENPFLTGKCRENPRRGGNSPEHFPSAFSLSNIPSTTSPILNHQPRHIFRHFQPPSSPVPASTKMLQTILVLTSVILNERN